MENALYRKYVSKPLEGEGFFPLETERAIACTIGYAFTGAIDRETPPGNKKPWPLEEERDTEIPYSELQRRGFTLGAAGGIRCGTTYIFIYHPGNHIHKRGWYVVGRRG